MIEAPTRPDGEVLELAAYYADFAENFVTCSQFWKLERGQFFAEPGDASWEAFNQGDWQQALQLLAERKADLVDYHRGLAEQGTTTRRVRIVDLPPTPYLQWELHLLRLRDETGGAIRVLPGSMVAAYECDGPLPDIYTMDDTVMYEAVYDANGVLETARRFIAPDLVRRWRTFISALWAEAEGIQSFFEREIAQLPPPCHTPTSIYNDYLGLRGRPIPPRS